MLNVCIGGRRANLSRGSLIAANCATDHGKAALTAIRTGAALARFSVAPHCAGGNP